MTDTTTPAALEIPQAAADAARDALWDCLPDTYDPQDMAFLACYLEEHALPAAAGGIVAAELRRLSDHYGEEAERCDEHPASYHHDGGGQYVWGEGHGYSNVADALLARADELDSERFDPGADQADRDDLARNVTRLWAASRGVAGAAMEPVGFALAAALDRLAAAYGETP